VTSRPNVGLAHDAYPEVIDPRVALMREVPRLGRLRSEFFTGTVPDPALPALPSLAMCYDA
jgi:hypothetical protein